MSEHADILPFLLYTICVGVILATTLLISWFAGSKSRHGRAQDIPYESGIIPVGEAENMRLSVEFFLVAIFFVIFDLETIFIVAWAVVFRDVGWLAYIAMAVFIGILLIALFYEWRTGALEWGVKSRHTAPDEYSRADMV